MIIAKKYDENKDSKETSRIMRNIMKMYNIPNDEKDTIYLMKENDVIIGISTAIIKDDFGILKSIIIRHEYRGYDYGDGLLRAMLNFIYRKNIETVLFLHKSDYLSKKGFQYTDQNELYAQKTQLKFISDKPMICNLEDFFARSCKH